MGAPSASSDAATLWHRRLAHAGYSTLAKLVRNHMADGINVPAEVFESALSTICEPCIMGKHARSPFGTSTTKTNKPLELLHMDLCTMPVRSLGGSKYFATVLDDYTSYSVVEPVAFKSDTTQFAIDTINNLETRTGQRVCTVRTDNGGEYVNNELNSFFKLKGITHETTAAYTPQQNGKAERLNRTLLEKVRALLADSSLPDELWAEALAYANYSRVRSPVSGKDATPWQLLFGRKPDISGLRVFGSLVYAQVPAELRRKLDNTSQRGTMIGYGAGTKAYRILLDSGDVVISRDVIFDETARGTGGNIIKPRVDPTAPDLELLNRDYNKPAQDASVISTQAAPPAGELHANQGNVNLQEDDDNAAISQQATLLQSDRISSKPREWWVAPPAAHVSFAEEPTTMEEALSGPNAEQWKTAMDEELESVLSNSTWEYVDLPPGAKAIPLKWVYKIKRDGNGNITRFKARLVVKGYMQREGIDYEEVFAPVSKYATLRTLMAVTASLDLHLHMLDFKTAFLNGDVDEEVYVSQPPGYPLADTTKVCKLKRALYGLHQAPRAWHLRLKRELEAHNFTESKADPGLYILSCNTGYAYTLVYVDDVLIAAKQMDTVNKVKSILMAPFDARDMGEATLFLGITIERDRGNKTIKLGQERLAVDIVNKFNMAEAKGRQLPITPGIRLSKDEGEPLDTNKWPYAAVVGSLLYLSTCTRPDLTQAVGVLSKYMASPTTVHWQVAKGLLRYVASTTTYGIIYTGRNHDAPIIEGYCDADYAGDVDTRRSTSGYVFTMAGGAISWGSRRQDTVAASTTEAKYIAAATAVKEALWLRQLAADLHVDNASISIKADNQSAIKLLKNPVSSVRSKHIDVAYHFARERVARKEVSFHYVNTEHMIADMLTKPVHAVKLAFCCKGMGLAEGRVRER